MKRLLLFLLIPFLVFSAYKEGEVLVKIKKGRDISSLSISGILSSKYLFDKTYKLTFKNRSVEDVVYELSKDPNVVYAEPNYIRKICITPNDPYFNQQWGLNKISAPSAWEIEKGSSSVIVAILDTGIDYNHSDLNGKVIKGYDFVNNDNDPMDDHDYSLTGHSHGTHVAGIAGAETNNGTGTAGIAWDCKLLAVKCFNYKGEGEDPDIALAIRYAADYNGVKVINMSFGDTDFSQTLKEACDYAYGRGTLLVAAAGNKGNATMFYPAAYDNVMAVSATNQNDQKASFSNYGDWVDVASPGDRIYSTVRTNYGYYDEKNGTSMASPFVAGLGGLLFSKNPSWNNNMVMRAIKEGGDDIGGIYRIGKRINAKKSLDFNISTKTWTFIVYLDADNDLESAAIDDFLEMSSIGSNENVNIVVQFDRISYYDSNYGNWTGTKRFYITKDMTPYPENAIDDIGEANMGDPNTLKNFINWAKGSYPANNYALILWDHGSGWKTKALEKKPKCVCYDDTSDGDSLSLKELRETLSSCEKINLIGFDACLMAMAEVAHQIKDCGNIMVASEDVEPNDGWAYDKILVSIGSVTTSSLLAETIVQTYVSSYPGSDEITLSSIDLLKVGSLALSLGSITSINDWDKISTARNNVIFTRWDPSYIDLFDFANRLEVSLTSPILFSSHTTDSKNYSGLSIYFPKEDDGYLGTYTPKNLLFAKDTNWDEFILKFIYPPSLSFLLLSCPETITTYNTFTLTIFPKDSQGSPVFSTATITISNLTNSINPTTYDLTGYETKIIATITEMPDYGLDIITIKLSSLIATASVNVFLNLSKQATISTNNVELLISPNTFEVPFKINIATSSETNVPKGIKPVMGWNIFASAPLKGTITAKFSYPEINGIVSGTIKERNLCIFQDGKEIPYFIDISSNAIIATITEHLSLFTIGGTPTYPEEITKPTVFPNPFIWHKHSFITFGDPNIVEKRLPQGGSIMIYNIAGEMIDELFTNPEDNGRKIWNPKEKKLASGVYIFVINKKARGKIGIVK
ncbi:MAG: S8 family serine peptidase [bacterium]